MENQYSKNDFAQISPLLNSVNQDTRSKCIELFKDKLFIPEYDVSIREQKEVALRRLQKLSDSRIVSVRDFINNPENIFTLHEMLGFVDGSLATKFTVQFNLFGGTIVGLGTKRHEEMFEKIDRLKIIGCFCLTELGYGNNAVEMETTAIWDEKKKRFIINSPTINSQKYWITNGAYHANSCVVFAQTIIRGKNEGINAFIVPLRDDKMKLCPGVIIDDMGCKMALNGVDNARIIFKNIEIERTALLNKLADFNEKEEFLCKFTSRRQRFIQASNRLLSGRICIASMSISGAKLALLITCKYASERLSNGVTGKSDTPISKFQLFQNQIVPMISRTIILNLGLMQIRKVYCDYIMNTEKYNSDHFNNVIRLVCVIKPMIAWNTNQIGNICRERCGGQGYLSINRLECVVGFAHAAITAEGDSAVLMQKVSKEYVEDFTKQKVQPPTMTQCPKDISLKSSIFDLETIMNLIKHRETILLNLLAEKTVSKVDQIYSTWMLEESDLIQDLAANYGERYCLEESLKLFGKKYSII